MPRSLKLNEKRRRGDARKAGAARLALFYCNGGFGNKKHSEGCQWSMRAEITASIKDDAGVSTSRPLQVRAQQGSREVWQKSEREYRSILLQQRWNRLLARFRNTASFNMERPRYKARASISVCQSRCVGVCHHGPCLITIMAGCPIGSNPASRPPELRTGTTSCPPSPLRVPQQEQC